MTTGCAFHFGFWDVTAREDATLQVTDNQYWANVCDVNLEQPVQPPDVATLEPRFGWPLDGTKQVMPDDPGQEAWGLWSRTLSGPDGVFERPMVLTAQFRANHSSAGITLQFAKTVPRVVTVAWYGLDGTLLAEEDFVPEGLLCVCQRQVENYGLVVVTVPALCQPERYLRCEHIKFGLLITADGQQVQRAQVTEQAHPISLSLPVSTLELALHSGQLSLLNPGGAHTLLQRKQPVQAYATVDGAQRFMGTYYLQQALSKAGMVIDLSFVCAIGLLDTVEFDGGMYTNHSLTDFLHTLLDAEELEFTLSPELAGATLSGYLPICTKRQALQQAAFAVGAMVDAARDGGIHIRPMPQHTAHTIAPGRKEAGHNVTLEQLVTRVDVTAHTYRLEGETRQLTQVAVVPGVHRIAHSAPARVTAVSGGTLLETHPNYTTVQVASAGQLILTGNTYADTQSIYTAQTLPLPAGAKSSVKTVTDATLVTPANAAAAAQRVYDYYQRRYSDEGRILPGAEAVGQVVQLDRLGARSITGCIERLHIDLAGGYIAKLTMRGA